MWPQWSLLPSCVDPLPLRRAKGIIRQPPPPPRRLLLRNLGLRHKRQGLVKGRFPSSRQAPRQNGRFPSSRQAPQCGRALREPLTVANCLHQRAPTARRGALTVGSPSTGHSGGVPHHPSLWCRISSPASVSFFPLVAPSSTRPGVCGSPGLRVDKTFQREPLPHRSWRQEFHAHGCL